MNAIVSSRKMNPAHSQDPMPPLFAQLGEFSKLPPELRSQIWNNLFDGIFDNRQNTSHTLDILCCSRFLNEEISHLLYQNRALSLRLDASHARLVEGRRFIYGELSLIAHVKLNNIPFKAMKLSCLEDAPRLLRNFPYWRFRRPGPYIGINSFGDHDPIRVLELWDIAVKIFDTVDAMPNRRRMNFQTFSVDDTWIGERVMKDWFRERYPQQRTQRPLLILLDLSDPNVHLGPVMSLPTFYYMILARIRPINE